MDGFADAAGGERGNIRFGGVWFGNRRREPGSAITGSTTHARRMAGRQDPARICGQAGASGNNRVVYRLRQQSSRVPPPERNPRRLNPRNQTAFGRSRSIGSDAGAGWAPECALHLLHAQKATLSPPLSASISRASSGSATSEPSSSTMCRIFATCWALDSAS